MVKKNTSSKRFWHFLAASMGLALGAEAPYAKLKEDTHLPIDRKLQNYNLEIVVNNASHIVEERDGNIFIGDKKVNDFSRGRQRLSDVKSVEKDGNNYIAVAYTSPRVDSFLNDLPGSGNGACLRVFEVGKDNSLSYAGGEIILNIATGSLVGNQQDPKIRIVDGNIVCSWDSIANQEFKKESIILDFFRKNFYLPGRAPLTTTITTTVNPAESTFTITTPAGQFTTIKSNSSDSIEINASTPEKLIFTNPTTGTTTTINTEDNTTTYTTPTGQSTTIKSNSSDSIGINVTTPGIIEIKDTTGTTTKVNTTDGTITTTTPTGTTTPPIYYNLTTTPRINVTTLGIIEIKDTTGTTTKVDQTKGTTTYETKAGQSTTIKNNSNDSIEIDTTTSGTGTGILTYTNSTTGTTTKINTEDNTTTYTTPTGQSTTIKNNSNHSIEIDTTTSGTGTGILTYTNSTTGTTTGTTKVNTTDGIIIITTPTGETTISYDSTATPEIDNTTSGTIKITSTTGTTTKVNTTDGTITTTTPTGTTTPPIYYNLTTTPRINVTTPGIIEVVDKSGTTSVTTSTSQIESLLTAVASNLTSEQIEDLSTTLGPKWTETMTNLLTTQQDTAASVTTTRLENEIPRSESSQNDKPKSAQSNRSGAGVGGAIGVVSAIAFIYCFCKKRNKTARVKIENAASSPGVNGDADLPESGDQIAEKDSTRSTTISEFSLNVLDSTSVDPIKELRLGIASPSSDPTQRETNLTGLQGETLYDTPREGRGLREATVSSPQQMIQTTDPLDCQAKTSKGASSSSGLVETGEKSGVAMTKKPQQEDVTWGSWLSNGAIRRETGSPLVQIHEREDSTKEPKPSFPLSTKKDDANGQQAGPESTNRSPREVSNEGSEATAKSPSSNTNPQIQEVSQSQSLAGNPALENTKVTTMHRSNSQRTYLGGVSEPKQSPITLEQTTMQPVSAWEEGAASSTEESKPLPANHPQIQEDSQPPLFKTSTRDRKTGANRGSLVDNTGSGTRAQSAGAGGRSVKEGSKNRSQSQEESEKTMNRKGASNSSRIKPVGSGAEDIEVINNNTGSAGSELPPHPDQTTQEPSQSPFQPPTRSPT